MTLKPHPLLRRPIAWLDAVNPYIVIASIIGLLLEFTPLKGLGPVIPGLGKTPLPYFNAVTDVVFVIDFLVRLLAFPKRAYFFRHYGWVDLLAAVPGLLLVLEQVPSLLAAFKFLRIGRFFKIIRLLRFLKIFSFLRRMREDSPWVQDRIMKIGVVVVLVGVATIGVAETFVERHYLRTTREKLDMYEKLTGSFALAVQILPSKTLVAWQQGQNFSRPTTSTSTLQEETLSPGEYALLAQHEDALLVRLDPARSAILHDKPYLQDRNNVALTLMLALILTLLILLFYMGAVFARDMSLVALISDSIDAGDYTLLLEEGKALFPDGSLETRPGEDELLSLVKRMNRLVAEKSLQDDPGNGEGVSEASLHAAGFAELPASAQIEESLRAFKESFREELLADLRAQGRETAIEAVRISARSIVDYLKKHGFQA
ncbi:MAG: ion transporter [Spirochaetes bacterium]|nr:ion transporter [Spirochaetota bacterium]